MIEHWLINLIFFSVPFSWYMVYMTYKSLKTKDEVIDKLTEMLAREIEINNKRGWQK